MTQRVSSPRPVPMTVVGGYLGAGKSTLVNHVLRANDGRRLGVMVNDFGAVNIDAGLIENQHGDTVELTNGCVCCGLSNGFAAGLQALLGRDRPPEQILVEASGVADPSAIAGYGYLRGLTPDGVVVVADAETVRARSTDRYVGTTILNQLAGADLIVLNKVDLLDDGHLSDLRRWLGEVAGHRPVITTSHGVVAPQIVLGALASGRVEHPNRPAGNGVGHSPHDTWSFLDDAPLLRGPLEAALTSLPDGVIRAKGIVALSGEANRWIVQLVGRRLSITAAAANLVAPPGPSSQLVFIGLPGNVDPQQLEPLLRTAVADRSAGRP